MGYETERDVIRAKLNAWSTTPISWDAFNGSPYTRSEGTAFIRPRIEDGETPIAGIGGGTNRYRHFGTLLIEVFYPAARGQETPLQYCDSLISAFHKYESGGVNFWQRGSVSEAGSDGNFFKWFVLLPYYREELA